MNKKEKKKIKKQDEKMRKQGLMRIGFFSDRRGSLWVVAPEKRNDFECPAGNKCPGFPFLGEAYLALPKIDPTRFEDEAAIRLHLGRWAAHQVETWNLVPGVTDEHGGIFVGPLFNW